MNYGLYLSATGVLTSTHRIDVISNNLANTESHGFRRQIAAVQHRPPEMQEDGVRGGDPRLNLIGGGQLVLPSTYDLSAGMIEPTGDPLSAAIDGEGFFGVQTAEGTRLTRNGQFMINDDGELVLANSTASKVLDTQGIPIRVGNVDASRLRIEPNGELRDGETYIATIGTFMPTDVRTIRPEGETLFDPGTGPLREIPPRLQGGFIERSNVEPARELIAMMEAQRALDANANMIRYTDQTLGRLVNDVGRIG